jgi:hypothetical protein
MSEVRIDRLESRLDAVKEHLRRVEHRMIRIEEAVIRLEATLPHPATKGALADKPNRRLGIRAAMAAAYTAAIAAGAMSALVLTSLAHH